MKEGKIMAESFGDEFRNKQLGSKDINKQELDEIVQAAKDKVNEDQDLETYLFHDSRKLSFRMPKLSDTQLAYIAKELDMHVKQLENNSLDIICIQKPNFIEYLNMGPRLALICLPPLIAIFIVLTTGSIFDFNTANVIIKFIGVLVVLCGFVTGLYLGWTNNKLVEKAINSQIKNEILNK